MKMGFNLVGAVMEGLKVPNIDPDNITDAIIVIRTNMGESFTFRLEDLVEASIANKDEMSINHKFIV